MKNHRDSPARQTKAALALQGLGALVVVLLGWAFARYQLATLFQNYDDEGYFLTSLARYFGPGRVDPETFSHYGPFYYYAQEACFRLLRLPVTHDAGRLVTLLYWMTAALLGGTFVYRISKSLLLSAAATLACVRLGIVLASEPGHPQQVVLVLLALANCLTLPGFGRETFRLAALGAVGAALVFTKINVGAFYLAALAHALICLWPDGRLRKAGTGILLAYAALAPPLLMHAHLSSGALGYCFVAVLCCSATFAFAMRCVPEVARPPRGALYTMAGAVAAAGMIVLATQWQGVSLAALVQDILIDPARMPNLLYMGFRLGLGPCLAAVAAVAGLGAWFVMHNRLAQYHQWLGGIRCAIGVAAIFLLIRSDLPWVVPLLPLGLIPIAGRPWRISNLLPRLFLADLAATEFLQTYPVAGSQVGIVSVIVALWAFVCITDGIDEFLGDRQGHRARWNNAFAGLIVAVIAAGLFGSGFRGLSYPFPASKLEGASSLHLPPEQAARYQHLAAGIRANCSVLFTMPRMGSFNFWSGVPAPAGSNATVSMKSYSLERQTPILDLLQSDPRACVLYNPQLLDFWQTTPDDLFKLPLAKYILDQMPRRLEDGGYQIRVSPGRTSPWIGIAP